MKLTTFQVLSCFFIFTNCTSEGDTAEYKACSADYSCGAIQNVRYPFWGGNRPQFCGCQEFLLSCPSRSDEYPNIDIGMPKWPHVLEINTSAQKIVIALHRFLCPDPTCYTEPHPTQKTTFEFSSNYHPKTFACSYLSGTNGSAFYFLKRSGFTVREGMSCMDISTIPVLETLEDLNNGNSTLLGVLRKGFKLGYALNSAACSACQSSGGQCGSSDVHHWSLYATALLDLSHHCVPKGHQQSFCGYPGYQVTCGTNNYMIINHSNDTYAISEISYFNQTLVVINTILLQTTFNCSPAFHNFTLDDLRFQFASNHSVVFFLQNCCTEAQRSLAQYPQFSCGPGSNKSIVIGSEKDDCSGFMVHTNISVKPAINEQGLEMLEGSLEILQMPPKPDLSSPSRSVFYSSSTPQLTT
ncbi:hypothetical protein Cgig2_010669 [Carnegiea gigantea]|uniref:non-specific serine/threonine protein kinase n=1 Tax=Carnegiea gigantea TaxID=171969 RepID=A0A9Q1KM75_9CARY|nr:hypothetical protein Cgig2_010669 [Carnegiea gigantea]